MPRTSATIITNMRVETAESIVMVNCPEGTYPEQWDVAGLKDSIDAIFGLQPPIDDWLQEEEVDQQIITERLQALADEAMAAKTAELEPERWIEVERQILLQTLDEQLEGASRDARRAAPGHPPAQLRAEEADQRI